MPNSGDKHLIQIDDIDGSDIKMVQSRTVLGTFLPEDTHELRDEKVNGHFLLVGRGYQRDILNRSNGSID